MFRYGIWLRDDLKKRKTRTLKLRLSLLEWLSKIFIMANCILPKVIKKNKNINVKLSFCSFHFWLVSLKEKKSWWLTGLKCKKIVCTYFPPFVMWYIQKSVHNGWLADIVICGITFVFRSRSKSFLRLRLGSLFQRELRFKRKAQFKLQSTDSISNSQRFLSEDTFCWKQSLLKSRFSNCFSLLYDIAKTLKFLSIF